MLNFTRRTLIGWCTVCNERKSQINFLIGTIADFSFSCQNSAQNSALNVEEFSVHLFVFLTRNVKKLQADAQLCEKYFDRLLYDFVLKENPKLHISFLIHTNFNYS